MIEHVVCVFNIRSGQNIIEDSDCKRMQSFLRQVRGEYRIGYIKCCYLFILVSSRCTNVSVTYLEESSESELVVIHRLDTTTFLLNRTPRSFRAL